MKEKAEAFDLGFASHGVIIIRLLLELTNGGMIESVEARVGNRPPRG